MAISRGGLAEAGEAQVLMQRLLATGVNVTPLPGPASGSRAGVVLEDIVSVNAVGNWPSPLFNSLISFI